jgi:hypothetical protein
MVTAGRRLAIPDARFPQPSVRSALVVSQINVVTFTRQQQELLEAYGFDLMAQIEAMLRHVREYQRALQRFRGTLPPPEDRAPLETMGDHVRALRAAVTEFDTCLEDIEHGIAHTGKGEKAQRTDRGIVRPDPVTWRKRRP